MSENGNESKKYKYLVTMRWYVETDEALVAVRLKRTKSYSTSFAIGKMAPKAAVPAQRETMKAMAFWTTIILWVIKNRYICQQSKSKIKWKPFF